MAGMKKKLGKIKKSTGSSSKKPLKSSEKARSSTSEKTRPKSTRNADSVLPGSPKDGDSSSSSTKTLRRKTTSTLSTPKSLIEAISNILKNRTTAQNSRHSSNLARAKNLVEGEFRRPGRPKKEVEKKEKLRSLRVSDEFIVLAKHLADLDGFDGRWQTWLKSLAEKRFSEVSKGIG
jgi:hypothetical protein